MSVAVIGPLSTAYANVFRCSVPGVAGECVLKRPSHKSDRTLLRELHILTHVHHPHVARVLSAAKSDVGHIDYLVFPNLGVDLYSVVTEPALAPVYEAVKTTIAGVLCSTLAFLHHCGVSHRDVKLENVLADRATGHLTLIDFGLAVAGSEATTLTELVGSRAYAAPELLITQKYQGESVDAWSLGVTLFAFFAKRLPFPLATLDCPEFMEVFAFQNGSATVRVGTVAYCLSRTAVPATAVPTDVTALVDGLLVIVPAGRITPRHAVLAARAE